MAKTCILLNGPSVSGKGVAVKHLMSKLGGVNISCKDHLHGLVMKMFNVAPEKYWNLYNNRQTKEVPNQCYRVTMSDEEYDIFSDFCGLTVSRCPLRNRSGDTFNLSPREVLIYVSECWMKPHFGGDYFGKVRAQKVVASCADIIYDDSLGFVSELPPLIEAVGQENILAIRIHREGFTFAGDSRNYIPDGVIENTVDIHNEEGKEEEYLDKIFHAVAAFHNNRRII